MIIKIHTHFKTTFCLLFIITETPIVTLGTSAYTHYACITSVYCTSQVSNKMPVFTISSGYLPKITIKDVHMILCCCPSSKRGKGFMF